MESSERSELQERILTLQNLADHPGWALFASVLHQSISGVYAGMMKAPDAHGAAKALGAFDALTQISGWMRRELDVCATRLQEQQ